MVLSNQVSGQKYMRLDAKDRKWQLTQKDKFDEMFDDSDIVDKIDHELWKEKLEGLDI